MLITCTSFQELLYHMANYMKEARLFCLDIPYKRNVKKKTLVTRCL